MRSGFSVSFTKIYDEARRLRACPIACSGAANTDFDMVEGDWVLMERNPLRGGFQDAPHLPGAAAAKAGGQRAGEGRPGLKVVLLNRP